MDRKCEKCLVPIPVLQRQWGIESRIYYWQSVAASIVQVARNERVLSTDDDSLLVGSSSFSLSVCLAGLFLSRTDCRRRIFESFNCPRQFQALGWPINFQFYESPFCRFVSTDEEVNLVDQGRSYFIDLRLWVASKNVNTLPTPVSV